MHARAEQGGCKKPPQPHASSLFHTKNATRTANLVAAKQQSQFGHVRALMETHSKATKHGRAGT
jgi:hypothetical protein